MRLKHAGVTFCLNSVLKAAEGRTLTIVGPKGETRVHAADAVIIAIGPQQVRDMLPVLERAGVEYVLAGDCQQPGDFMSAVRDGFFVGLSLRTRFGDGRRAR